MWTHLDDSASEWWSLWDGVSSHFVAPLRRGFFGRLPKLNRAPSKRKQLFILSLTASEMSSRIQNISGLSKDGAPAKVIR
jgi:hypothetical protein